MDNKTEQIIEALADYFTGPSVVNNSICLELGGMSKVDAQRYFELRALFGIQGYDDKEQALKIIRKIVESK